ncbi:MAG: alanine racemase [Planctomycetes bacterium]|nr:alanine racemase [Planctomycetota bacterium]
MSRPTYAEIDLAALRHNCRTLRDRVGPGVRILGVVKADGYGHGAVEAGRAMAGAGIDMLGVAIVEEGVALRVHGIRTPILVMGLTPDDEAAAAIEYGLTPTVDGPATAEPLERRAAAKRVTLAVHLKIDTGMNRLGVRAEEAADAARAVAACPHLTVAGAYTHLACADSPDDAVSAEQLARFAQALDRLRAAGIRPEVVHAANSSALLRAPESHFDMVRAGLALYGVHPCEAVRDVPLRPVMSLVTHVVATKRVRAGEGVSYGHQWRAGRDALVGVLPIGYADGYPRALSNRAQVRVGGRLAPVVGAVCMDMVLVDLTDVPEAAPGLEVTLIEADPASPLSAAALAGTAGAIPYEILTGIGKRVPRVYRG